MLHKSIRYAQILFIIIIVSATSVFSQNGPLDGLDKQLEQIRKDWEIPGLAVGIVQDDVLIYAKGFGVRELGKPGKVDEQTLFAVASNSKAFTATILGILVDEGKLDWDDRVIDYLPEFQMADAYVTQDMRIRDLLCHRSGLPTFGGDHIWIGNPKNDREKILHQLRYLEPTAPFRAKYQYQNLMFLVAGQVAAAVYDQSWDDVIQNRIFTPLEMKKSNTSIRHLESIKNVAVPHEPVEGKVIPVAYDNVDGVAPAAAINSNIVDMAQWMRLNLKKGSYKGKQLVSKKVMKDLHAIQMPFRVSDYNAEHLGSRFAGYGLGWGISDYKGHTVVRHGGGLTGMLSLQTLIPEKGIGVMVLTNYAPSSPTQAITFTVLDRLLGEPYRDWSGESLKRTKERAKQRALRKSTLQASRINDTKPSLPLEQYTGTYFEPFSGKTEIRLENGHLVFDYNPRHIGKLVHWHYDTFRVIWQHPIFDMPAESFLTFSLDETGVVQHLVVTYYDPITFHRVMETEK